MTILKPKEELLITAPEVIAQEGDGESPSQLEVEMKIRQGDREAAIWFRITNVAPVEPSLALEAVLAMTLVPAMRLGSPLRVEGGVDRRILDGVDRFQEVFSTWYPEFQRVPVEAEAVDRPADADAPQRVGVFFTGGIDSTYSLLKNRSEITHAVFVHGCDIPLENEQYRQRVSASLREAAAAHGVELIEVESNFMDFITMSQCHWAYHYHGSCLAAIAMLLSGSMRKMFIAGSYRYDGMVPWGSTFFLDPLWSSSRMEIVHDGGEHNRLGKTQAISSDPVALRHLRVCFENPEQGYNCGRCEKCCRTMVALRISGALDRCQAFNEPLDLKWMVESKETREMVGEYKIWEMFKEQADRQGDDPELVEALAELLKWDRLIRVVREIAATKVELIASKPWRDALPKFRSSLWDSLRENDPSWLKEKTLKWLPEIREKAFDRLLRHDRRWFKRRFRSQNLSRFLKRFRGGRSVD